MKKGLSLLALASFLSLGSSMAQAQAGLKKADRQYDQWAYVDALNIYEKIEKRGYSNQEIHEHLGNAYYFNARYAEAEKQYEKLFAIETAEEIAVEYYYRYAETLQHVGKAAEAKSYYNQFVSKVGSTSQVAGIRKSEAALQQQIQANSGRYNNVENLPINTQFADFGSYVHNNQLYFTSARDTGSLSKKVHTWTGASFTSLYNYSLANESGKHKVNRLKGNVKSKLNESSAVVTADGSTMYFTRNNIIDGARKYDESGNTNLKIYRAQQKNGKWENVEELPFNGNDFNTAHPALSPDEQTLYFSSDRPGGFGESDLWQVSVHPSGSFGNPQNLGPMVNTEFRETFPYVNSNNELYFSSNGRVGLGGLDVYVTKVNKDRSYSEVQNVGEPVNSKADDFAYYIDYQTKSGFFSSNRDGGKGNDDIYGFVETRMLALDCTQDLIVTVVDAKTRNVLTDVSITLYDRLYNELGTSKPTSKGNEFATDYECGELYRLKVEKPDYITKEETVTLNQEMGITEKTIVLERKKVEVKKNDDLFKVLKLNPIYFDLDKDNIRPDAAIELAKVAEVLKDYPNMKIDVRSHTDSRASDDYNLKLSQRRAKSTAAWLVSQGIDSSRITYKGYGETQLENKCSNGVKCTEEQHQQNRRSEFIVVEY